MGDQKINIFWYKIPVFCNILSSFPAESPVRSYGAIWRTPEVKTLMFQAIIDKQVYIGREDLLNFRIFEVEIMISGNNDLQFVGLGRKPVQKLNAFLPGTTVSTISCMY